MQEHLKTSGIVDAIKEIVTDEKPMEVFKMFASGTL